MKDCTNYLPTPKIRNLSTGFVLLTVGPYQEAVEVCNIHQTTQNLQARYRENFISHTDGCYILNNRKNFLECLHHAAQKLKP
jgi:hypothetical protein